VPGNASRAYHKQSETAQPLGSAPIEILNSWDILRCMKILSSSYISSLHRT